jgi:ribonuclease VapC
VIAVDSSALIAILFGEPQAEALVERLAKAPERRLSVVSYVETGTVIAGRMRGDPARAVPLLDAFLAELGVRLHPVDEAQMRIALQARIAYGRGFGAAAGLNFGDCFSYALAKTLAAPLLFVGDDFAAADLEPALG